MAVEGGVTNYCTMHSKLLIFRVFFSRTAGQQIIREVYFELVVNEVVNGWMFKM